MTTKVTVSGDQNLVDVALQEYGAVSGIVELAKRNGLAVSQDPPAEVEIETAEVVSTGNREFFQTRRRLVATGRDASSDDVGIGEMIIETNFIIR